jgi:hypothetical protein
MLHCALWKVTTSSDHGRDDIVARNRVASEHMENNAMPIQARIYHWPFNTPEWTVEVLQSNRIELRNYQCDNQSYVTSIADDINFSNATCWLTQFIKIQ